MKSNALWRNLSSRQIGPFVIAGPCVMESYELMYETASYIKNLCDRLGLTFVFKSSYDKANRTSIRSFRGPGLQKGLAWLERLKAELKVFTLTDVHSPEEARAAASVVDVLQIPAFLCRQTDLITAAASTGRIINVKKGQFLAPWDMKNVIEKIRSRENEKIILTERGSCFGYNNLVVDMRSITIMKALGFPVVIDATHSVQRPGGLGSCSGGERDFVPVIARAAVAAGADGVFLEVHPKPDEALCDGPNSWYLNRLEGLLKNLKAIYHAVTTGEQ
ncbi:3-deoxy-8-phosphooctulonate synthase [Thermodesulforhabdus norvegica]|uniref:2-dehydro-3-deoxyphosphooctonate aldolase n=1 Tax=Thermodesulforhabdus norvegica TaxID=39841 RepID=A0A1I4VIS3_9BACT|nr:3-deoxy-8-phosphooctulonate synthase [Thermodesulforhabdus norvegica]SFN01138.1 2-dehydro-3-deoxyphosphooctonate aldolase (KDO 8-P synthase) [Thermodesulforhabdus norvegica]